MKVLYLLNSNGVGGAEASIRRMVDKGFTDSQVVLLWSHNNVQENFWEGRRMTQLTDESSPLLGFIKSIFLLPKLVKKEKVDVVQSQLKGADLLLSFLLFTGLMKKDFTYLVSLRNSYDFYYGNGFVNRFIGRIHRYLINKTADKIVGVSKQDIDRFTNAFGKKFRVIENSVDITNFQTKDSLTIGSDVKIALVGNVKHRKGYDKLKYVVTYLNSAFPEKHFDFSIAGAVEDNTYMEDVKALEQGNVSINFLGKVERINDLLVSSDIFLSLSREEGLPISVLEAMASRVPILLSNIPAHSLILEPSVSESILFQTENELQKTLHQFVESEELRSKVVNEQYTKLTRDFSLERMCEQYLQNYKGER
ncbi:glycosyltransferase [Pseudoalteromonas umbrosa]|uniref:glycosyltransferase n=1 Tax=Pseudoalteromonas umbrosa TaxID=3048489 RepID=UPI0024C413D9|nr:glycosyltransferase [Pseudoalteromonas sp. B95]MDK1289586.1 glycosyltransferase [Pseudoalteromonas sp. B95]